MLIYNIGMLAGILPEGVGRLRGADIGRLESITDAWLLVRDGRIADFGTMDTCPSREGTDDIDARRGIVLPAFCDCHTHLVYAGSREGEFRDKIAGMSYAEIAARGGGILNSARRLAEATEDDLYEESLRRLRQICDSGTGAVEIKTGYGLTLNSELKMLRVIARLREAVPQMAIRATFLGAHAVGPDYTGRQEAYVDHVIDDMLPAVAAQGVADYVDVFCERGFFTAGQTSRILQAGRSHGLLPRLHADQLSRSGGTATGIAAGALSVDHLEAAGPDEIALLAASDTIGVGLPGASFFLSDPYAPLKDIIAAGGTVALASDYNPGTSPSGSMLFVWALGCIKMRLTPEAALNAATINGAAALGLQADYGSVTRGKRASLNIFDAPSLAFIPYAYTTPTLVATVR
ncbi:MAG: imidazolonepropionase [Bacteroides sp.]|nr:imidazolonepropionase [Bacteroides sp.]MCM1095891.1 imidazolonepropionase [Terasakiella sp.]